MENELMLVKPDLEHKLQAINFIEEVERNDLDSNIRFSGFNSLEEYKDNYEGWLKQIESEIDRNNQEDGKVPAHTFFSVRKSDNKVVGIINIRHKLNNYLYNYGGHIGYSILPSERRKGYAYKQLLLGLDFCKQINIQRALITCVDYNIGSSKTIEKAGGVLENIVVNPYKGVNEKRYWISLKKRYAYRSFDWIATNIEQKTIFVREEHFCGDIVFYNFIKAKEKFIIPNEGCILDNNYKWLEFYDYNSKIKLTAMYDKNCNVVQWYFDIAREVGKENGIPYEDDLYLDVVVTDSGKIMLLDEEELKEAYDRREMTTEEFEEAYKIANNLIERLKNKISELKKFI